MPNLPDGRFFCGKMKEKYIHHNGGLPLRIPPYLRRELRNGEPLALVQKTMMQNDPLVGQRGERDVLPINMEHNLVMRKSARVVSHYLVELAHELHQDRYATVVHGSVSKGLVRHPDDPDPSDIDIALLVETLPMSKERKLDIYKPVSRDSKDLFGTKTDVHIWSMEEVRKRHAELARILLRSGGYPLANQDGLWEEIRWLGLQCQFFLMQNRRVRKVVRETLPHIANGENKHTEEYLNSQKDDIGVQAYMYLCDAGFMDPQHGKKRATTLFASISCEKENVIKMGWEIHWPKE